MNARPATARDLPSAKVSRASWFWNVIVGGAAFFCTCLALHAVLPTPNVWDVGPKMRFFAAHKDEFDTIFVGSSHIYFGVSPAVFDEVLAQSGVPSRTFNFGASGMYPPEKFYVLDQILALKPRNLKRVFLEIDDVQLTWLPDKQTSQRVVYWHDRKNTWIIIRKLLNLDVREPLPRKLRMLRKARHTIALHLMLWARNFGNLGRALDVAESFFGGNQMLEKLGPKLDGYFPVDEEISREKELAYEKELAREQAAKAENVALDPYAEQAYRRYAREIRRAGATPIFLVAPIFPQLPSQFSGPPPGLLLAYNKPALYPDFYRSAARIDAHHLNPAGAERFTRRIAEDFLTNTRPP